MALNTTSTVDEASEEGSVAGRTDLASELCELSSAVDGQTVQGTVTEPPHESVSGEQITVTVETPISEFSHTFEKPKPPVGDYAFTRVVEEYGIGLVDTDALAGSTVPCVYDEDDAEWSIEIPKQPTHKRLWESLQSTETVWKLLMGVGGLLAMPIAYVGIMAELRHDDSVDCFDWYYFGFLGLCIVLLWCVVLAGFLGIVDTQVGAQ